MTNSTMHSTKWGNSRKTVRVFCSPTNTENTSENVNSKEISLDIIQKGYDSLDNPMLRGSFSLVLNEKKIEFLDSVAKKAFEEIMLTKLMTVTNASKPFNTIHCITDPDRIQTKRPGVYVIKNVETGMCIVGQTKDLRKRLNQYSSRSIRPSSASDNLNRINMKYRYDAQQAIKKGLAPSQLFQRYVVYTWVDQNGHALDVDSSLNFKNEMLYLEHRLILAFFECQLCYNLEDAVALLQLRESPLITNTTDEEDIPSSPLVYHKQPSKPFKVRDLYFYGLNDYSAFRESLYGSERKQFYGIPSLRKYLRSNSGNLNAEMRYLTSEEILEANQKNLWKKVDSTENIN